MDLQNLTDFFMWCTIISGGIYIYTAIMMVFASDFVFRVQGKMFSLNREDFNNSVFNYMGMYKIVFIVFVLVPYMALLIIT